jgi:transcriptional/translational regulatory protein YebC/TACO1
MLKSLSYHLKNKLLISGVVLLAILSWNLAFRKTYNAIALNSELRNKMERKSDLSINPDYLKRKHQVLSQVLKHYTLDSTQWKNDFWLKVSRVAASKEVSITYNPSAYKAKGDSVSQIVKQEIAFKADFKKLVSLLDSLERIEGVGFITSSIFLKEKKLNIEEAENLYLKTSFGIVQKQSYATSMD